jgi:hypothetical protein
MVPDKRFRVVMHQVASSYRHFTTASRNSDVICKVWVLQEGPRAERHLAGAYQAIVGKI